MKNISLLLSLILYANLTLAQEIAVACNEQEDLSQLIQICKEMNSTYTIIDQPLYCIVDKQLNDVIPSNLYRTTISKKDKHLCFTTNELIITTTKTIDDLPINCAYTLRKNPIIPNMYFVKLAIQSSNEIDTYVTALESLKEVSKVSLKQVFTIDATSNDTYYDRQWAIENTGSALQQSGTVGADMQVDDAWTITEGNSTLRIAILDSGVDTTHPDLINNLVEGYDAFSTDTSAGTRGYPTPNFSSDGHGTACAGIAAATKDNNEGISGIAPSCQIVPIRIFYYVDYGGQIGVQATTNTEALLNGSAYAWRTANVDVMSTSAGLSPLFIGALNITTQIIDDEIEAAFYQGRNGKGVPMFFSAGNDDFADVLWPADLNTTIAVGASTMCDERKNPNDCSPESWGSSYGEMLDIVAPGVWITTTDLQGSLGYNNGDYAFTFNGTSAACPNAAGVGALILAVNPNLHARDVKAILNETADRVGGYAYDSLGMYGTWNEEMGHGRVNAFKALQLAPNYASTVGIHSITNEIVTIYPNPIQNEKFTIKSSIDFNFQLIDALGRICFEGKVNKDESKHFEFKEKGVFWLRSQLGTKVLLFK